jgi:hypothetical protein
MPRVWADGGTGIGPHGQDAEVPVMLWTIFVIVLVLWLLGLIGSVGGSFIHLLLLVAGVILVVELLSGRRTV